MPRLQILQHKSYHPYLESNKQRVRDDEAKARAEELVAEQKIIDREAEARLNILRRRAGSPSFQEPEPPAEDNLPSTSTIADGGASSALLEKHRKAKAREEKREKKKRDRLDFDFPVDTRGKGKDKEKEKGRAKDVESGDAGEGVDGLKGFYDKSGHLNFWADMEDNPDSDKPQISLADIAKSKKEKESDPFTMYLGRPEKEMKPWYSDKELRHVEERETGEEAERRRARDQRKDIRSKDRHDPLTQIHKLLPPAPRKSTSIITAKPTDPKAARLARESSERQRALALIAKSKAPPRGWDETPSSFSGSPAHGWADNIQRQKDRSGTRFWGKEAPGSNRRYNSWEDI